MFSFGENLWIEIDELVPWLFWVNILAMLLLLLLLYLFINLGFEDTKNRGESSMSRDMTINSINNNKKEHCHYYQQTQRQENKNNSSSSGTTTSKLVSRRIFPEEESKMKADQTITVGKTMKSTSSRRRNDQGIQELMEESSSTRREVDASISDFPYNPCSWLELAGRAFLKCLGLDTSTSSTSQDN